MLDFLNDPKGFETRPAPGVLEPYYRLQLRLAESEVNLK
jgi:hypothetical protein